VGRNSTIDMLGKTFWWHGFDRDARRWVRACDPCHRRKTPRPMTAGLPQNVTVSRPGHTIAIEAVRNACLN
jgi:hypothetical protein